MSEILEDKVAVVTGAARGLGHAIADALAAAGATVVRSDLDASNLGPDGVACDVRDESQVEALVLQTVERHGGLDVAVSCAGVASVQPLVSMSLTEWRQVLSVDLDGVFLTNKHAARVMAELGGGSIINLASIKAFGGSPATGHYGAAKAGVVSLTKTAALELRGYNVRVNAICPGWIDTEMVSGARAELERVLGVSFDDYISHIQGRLGEPSEVAGLAVFLASDRSRFCSGSTYVVDGGATASLV